MLKVCVRCGGKCDVYQVGGGYTQVDMGGKKVKCPLCLGKGKVDLSPAKAKARRKPVKKIEVVKNDNQEASESESS